LPGVGNKKVPFRKWYGNLSEMRSHISDHVNQIVVTATAIFDILKLNKQCAIVTESPDRSNLFYCFQHFDKSLPLDLLFDDIIKEIQINDVTAKRIIIYCQTRKQCGLLYKMFEVALGSKFYKGSSNKPTRCLVEMYHAGTPSSVKNTFQGICENLMDTLEF
jgi:superfamily II DNA helicase RecQ